MDNNTLVTLETAVVEMIYLRRLTSPVPVRSAPAAALPAVPVPTAWQMVLPFSNLAYCNCWCLILSSYMYMVMMFHDDTMMARCFGFVLFVFGRCGSLFHALRIRIQRAVPTSSYLRRSGFVFVFRDGGDRPKYLEVSTTSYSHVKFVKLGERGPTWRRGRSDGNVRRRCQPDRCWANKGRSVHKYAHGSTQYIHVYSLIT